MESKNMTTLREFLRAKCGLPEHRADLNPRIIGRLEFDDFIIEKLIYDAEQCSSVPAHLYLPKGVRSPVPALVMACGHGGSKSVFFNQYAGQLYAKAGVAVLLSDPLGEEERDPEGRIGTRAHDRISEQAQQLGRPVLGKMVWDLMRGIDYLETRPEIDAQKIGVAGHSLGAIVSAYIAAIDERIRLSILAAMYFDPAEGGKHCTTGIYELIREKITYPMLIGLGAPRCATLMVVGDDDSICRGRMVYEQGFKRTFDIAKEIYTSSGAEGRLAKRVYPDAGHRPYFLTKEAMLCVEEHFDLPKMSEEQIRTLPSIRLGKWAEQNGVIFERLYGTEQHYAGLAVPDMGVHFLSPKSLACLSSSQRLLPEFTINGWLSCIKK